MTVLLEKAFAEVARLSDPEQDALAGWILEEIASERRWDHAFAESHELLQQMASEAWVEHSAGKSEVLDPETL
ncbi:MAG TPA: hypothetical protein VN937_15680 [Blastocatellia bacterium]|nr:hypothetical protein [Blastocatellia bacterium]